MKKSLIPAGLLATFPLALLVTGCSGGSSGGLGNVSPTPTSLPTATPVSTMPPIGNAPSNSSFTLASGQRVTLQISQIRDVMQGTINISAATAGNRATNALTQPIPNGSFRLSGNVYASGTFTLDAFLFGPQSFDFTLTGKFPTATTAGTYTLTSNGETETGVYPKLS